MRLVRLTVEKNIQFIYTIYAHISYHIAHICSYHFTRSIWQSEIVLLWVLIAWHYWEILFMTLNTALCEELLIKFDEGALKEKAWDHLWLWWHCHYIVEWSLLKTTHQCICLIWWFYDIIRMISLYLVRITSVFIFYYNYFRFERKGSTIWG